GGPGDCPQPGPFASGHLLTFHLLPGPAPTFQIDREILWSGDGLSRTAIALKAHGSARWPRYPPAPGPTACATTIERLLSCPPLVGVSNPATPGTGQLTVLCLSSCHLPTHRRRETMKRIALALALAFTLPATALAQQTNAGRY